MKITSQLALVLYLNCTILGCASTSSTPPKYGSFDPSMVQVITIFPVDKLTNNSKCQIKYYLPCPSVLKAECESGKWPKCDRFDFDDYKQEMLDNLRSALEYKGYSVNKEKIEYKRLSTSDWDSFTLTHIKSLQDTKNVNADAPWVFLISLEDVKAEKTNEVVFVQEGVSIWDNKLRGYVTGVLFDGNGEVVWRNSFESGNIAHKFDSKVDVSGGLTQSSISSRQSSRSYRESTTTVIDELMEYFPARNKPSE